MSLEEEKNILSNIEQIKLDPKGNLFYRTHNCIYNSDFVEIYRDKDITNFLFSESCDSIFIFKNFYYFPIKFFQDSEILEFDITTKKTSLICKCNKTIDKSFIDDERLYVSFEVEDYIFVYDIKTKVQSSIPFGKKKIFDLKKNLHSGGGSLYFAEGKIYFFISYSIFCIENGITTLFFEQKEYDSKPNRITDIFIKDNNF